MSILSLLWRQGRGDANANASSPQGFSAIGKMVRRNREAARAAHSGQESQNQPQGGGASVADTCSPPGHA